MTDLLNLTFNLDDRFNDQSPGSETVVNNNVSLDSVERFSGNASARFNGNINTFLEVDNTSSSFLTFNNNNNLFISFKFFLPRNGEFGLLDKREDVDNRWNFIIDSNSTNDFIQFIAREGGSNIISGSFAQTNLSKFTTNTWHTIEIAIDGNDHVRCWVDKIYLGEITISDNTAVENVGKLQIGRVNKSSTATADFIGFDKYIDDLLITDTIPTDNTVGPFFFDFSSTDDQTGIIWTGEVERLEQFVDSSDNPEDKTIQPNILDPTKFPNNIADFSLATDQLYIAGINPMRKVDDNNILDVGMEGPSSVSFSATNSGSNVDYVITFRDKRLNESTPSPLSSSQGTPSTGSPNTITAPSSPPSNADSYRVYRRNITAGQALHFLLGDDIPLTSNYVDDDSDTPSLSIFAPSQDSILPPIANYITYNKGRQYYGDVGFLNDDNVLGSRFPTRVYFSRINELELLDSSSWFFVGDNDSEAITGLTTFRGNVIIFKERSLILALGDPLDPGFQLPTVSRSIGCVAHQTIKEAGNRLMWLDDEGIYAWSGDANPILISEKIESLIENMPDERKPYATAAVDQELGLYLLSLSLRSTDVNDTILCYNYRDSFKDGQNRWTLWPVETTSLTEGFIGLGRNARAFFTDNQGRLGQFERGLDFQEGIDFTWKSGRFNTFAPGWFTNVKFLTYLIDLIGDGQRFLNVGFELDERGEVLKTFRNPTSNNFKVLVGGRSEYISLVIKGVDIRERLRIYGYQIDGNRIGRR